MKLNLILIIITNIFNFNISGSRLYFNKSGKNESSRGSGHDDVIFVQRGVES